MLYFDVVLIKNKERTDRIISSGKKGRKKVNEEKLGKKIRDI